MENIFDDIDLEDCPTMSSTPAKEQLHLKRRNFNTSGCYNAEASISKQPVEGNEVIDMLTTISKQLDLTTRVCNLENKIDKHVKENIIHKSEEMAQQKTIRECKVLIRKIHQSVCRMTGEEVDNDQTEIASTLPLNTLASALEMDEKLKCDEFAAATKQFDLRLKGTSDSVHDVLRSLYTDELVYLCNWDGRGGKQPLSKFLLVSNILYDSFITYGLATFEKQVRKAFGISHHRHKQRIYRKRKTEE
ncbi:uncharacterized protein LOC128920552 [Zeugodacus cucurbitae]|uniref:uncharacterized protein LOC128920552 n=1 Tax=Zeugodacus cucurbitae TaxID=28588 RepID=UPI0023D93C4F|nr:uncharacterized protein LOC128920552 [Zeugodacus cucurbitae]